MVGRWKIGWWGSAAGRVGGGLAGGRGHARGGAVAATLEQLREPQANQSPNLRSIVERIRPAIEPLLRLPLAMDPEALAARAVRADVEASVPQLRRGAAVL